MSSTQSSVRATNILRAIETIKAACNEYKSPNMQVIEAHVCLAIGTLLPQIISPEMVKGVVLTTVLKLDRPSYLDDRALQSLVEKCSKAINECKLANYEAAIFA